MEETDACGDVFEGWCLIYFIFTFFAMCVYRTQLSKENKRSASPTFFGGEEGVCSVLNFFSLYKRMLFAFVSLNFFAFSMLCMLCCL